MKSNEFYVAPDIKMVDLDHEGVLCSSQSNGGIDNLTPGNDWSDDLWK
ncbi:MAG: hypothetical protein IKW11_00250 [Bacteroidales bacterium]|nr:hypothetical protein [Bacteroidales bacterium]